MEATVKPELGNACCAYYACMLRMQSLRPFFLFLKTCCMLHAAYHVHYYFIKTGIYIYIGQVEFFSGDTFSEIQLFYLKMGVFAKN